jgi:thymidylate kinase
MTSIALIGGDGAGKSTVAHHLVADPEVRAKYLYMGISAQSSSNLLPTSRLFLLLKRRSHRRKVVQRTGRPPSSARIPAADYEYSTRQRGSFWVAARLLNRFAEAWYRQLLSLSYQWRGFLVVYDRHFLFDGGLLQPAKGGRSRHPAERLYRWAMRRFYPRPDLVILLDASGEVLHERKGEASVDYLDRWSAIYAAQAAAVKEFVRIDAAQPLEDVTREVGDVVAAVRRVRAPGDR